MSHKIVSGSAHIIATGSVFSFNGEPVTITLNDDKVDESIAAKVEFVFEQDSKDPKMRIVGDPQSPLMLRIHLINFNNALSEGLDEPIALGKNEKSVLYCMFRANTYTPKTWRLDFTFYDKPNESSKKV